MLLLLALALSCAASAKTISIPATDAHIDLPEGWTVKQQDIAFYAVAPDHSASITIALFSNTNGQGVETARFFSNMEGVLNERASKERASMKVISEGSTDLNGVPADTLQAELAFAEGVVAYGRSYALAENGHILVLTLLSPDPNSDARLQAIARTLRFNRPPVLPGATLWGTYHLGWALLAVVLFVMIGIIVIAMVKRRAR